MKRATIFIAFFLIATILPLLTEAQDYDSTYHVHGVSTMQLIITQNEDTALWELRRYNRDGYRTAYHYSTPPGKYNVDIHDTCIFRSPGFYSSIDRGNRRNYDSINSITKHGAEDTILKTYYENGKPRIRYLTTRSKTKKRVHTWYFEKPYTQTIHIEENRFDEKGRITGKLYIDSLIKGNSRTEKVKYHYYYKYTSEFAINTVYKVVDGKEQDCYVTFSSTDKLFDSIVMYNDDGSVDYYYAMHRDVQRRDSVSITQDGSGTITNRNVYTYSPGYRKTEHSDGKGFVFKTHEYFLNEDGLLVKDMETDHRSGDVRILNYRYTYF